MVSSYRLLFTDDAALLANLLLIFALTGLQHFFISHVRLHLRLQHLPGNPQNQYGISLNGTKDGEMVISL